jgi:hypothetical protein
MQERRIARLEKAAAAQGDLNPSVPKRPSVEVWRDILRLFLSIGRRVAEHHEDPRQREIMAEKVPQMAEAVEILDAYLAAGCATMYVEDHCDIMVRLTNLRPGTAYGRPYEERLPFLEIDPAKKLRECVELDALKAAWKAAV